MSQTSCESVWLLHTRKYTDSRILVDFLSEQGSLFAGVYRLASKASVPQPFKPLLVSWKGKHELKQVISLEQDDQTSRGPVNLTGTALYCGLYLNELLLRLLLRDDPHRNLFQYYSEALEELGSGTEVEPVLREFEFRLLEVLGYGLDFGTDIQGEAIPPDADRHYEFIFEEGFVPVAGNPGSNTVKNMFAGSVLDQLAQMNFNDHQTRRAAKQLSRLCIDRLLGGRLLKARELFRAE